MSSNINPEAFKWRLFLLDQKNSEYIQVSDGNFINNEITTFRISPTLKIGLNSVQSFRLYYYLVEDANNTTGYAGSTFEAKIKVE